MIGVIWGEDVSMVSSIGTALSSCKSIKINVCMFIFIKGTVQRVSCHLFSSTSPGPIDKPRKKS